MATIGRNYLTVDVGDKVYVSDWGIGTILYSLDDGTFVVENAKNGEQGIFSRRELASVTPFGE